MAGTATQTRPMVAARIPSFVLIAYLRKIHRFQRAGQSRANSSLDGRSLARHEAGGSPVLVALETDELHQVTASGLQIRTQQPAGELQIDRLRKRPRVVEEEIVGDSSVVDARPPLDRVQLFRMWRSAAVEPELVVVANGVDDQSVLFKLA